MRKVLTSFIVGVSCLTFAASANAGNSQGYESSLTPLSASSVRIDVTLSEDLQARAEGLSDGRKKCSSSRRLKSGFSCNGFYGQRDLDYLTEKLEKYTASALTKKGINVTETDTAETVLKLTLVDVKNNRPTHGQISHDTSLSFQSFALGGAEVSGEFFDANGNPIGTVSYSYYESFLDRFTQASGTWTDARQALQRFSTRVAKDVASKKL